MIVLVRKIRNYKVSLWRESIFSSSSSNTHPFHRWSTHQKFYQGNIRAQCDWFWFQLQSRQSIPACSVFLQTIDWFSQAVFDQRPRLLSPAITPVCGAQTDHAFRHWRIQKSTTQNTKELFYDLAILPSVSKSESTWAFQLHWDQQQSNFLVIHCFYFWKEGS